MRACWCVLAGTEACKYCSNNYEVSEVPIQRKNYTYTITTQPKTVEQHLKEVEKLIVKNKKLQKKYPNHTKDLQVGLESLEELRKEMLDAL